MNEPAKGLEEGLAARLQDDADQIMTIAKAIEHDGGNSVTRARARALAAASGRVQAVAALLPPPPARLEREAVARLVDPEIWSDYDACVGMGTVERYGHYSGERRRVASLTKADAILALTAGQAGGPTMGEMERARLDARLCREGWRETVQHRENAIEWIKRFFDDGLELSSALRAHGYPMSDAAWTNVKDGGASVEARRLHKAAQVFEKLLNEVDDITSPPTQPPPAGAGEGSRFAMSLETQGPERDADRAHTVDMLNTSRSDPLDGRAEG